MIIVSSMRFLFTATRSVTKRNMTKIGFIFRSSNNFIIKLWWPSICVVMKKYKFCKNCVKAKYMIGTKIQQRNGVMAKYHEDVKVQRFNS